MMPILDNSTPHNLHPVPIQEVVSPLCSKADNKVMGISASDFFMQETGDRHRQLKSEIIFHYFYCNHHWYFHVNNGSHAGPLTSTELHSVFQLIILSPLSAAGSCFQQKRSKKPTVRYLPRAKQKKNQWLAVPNLPRWQWFQSEEIWCAYIRDTVSPTLWKVSEMFYS